MLMTCGTIKQKAECFFVTKGQSYKIEKKMYLIHLQEKFSQNHWSCLAFNHLVLLGRSNEKKEEETNPLT